MVQDILTVTHKDCVEYYEQHYHPSNARFWFYGDDDEAERLALISEKLAGASKQDTVATSVQAQEAFTEPKVVEETFPGSSDDGAYVVSAWMLSDGPHGMPREDVLAMSVLHELLSGTRTSPLRAAMMEAGRRRSFQRY